MPDQDADRHAVFLHVVWHLMALSTTTCEMHPQLVLQVPLVAALGASGTQAGGRSLCPR